MLDELLDAQQVNKDSPLPYYYQIAQVLREAIDDAGDAGGPTAAAVALPSEPALARSFAVTRGTIRHALQTLAREGLIYREKGRGTFLKRRRVELDLTQLGSITAQMRGRQWAPGYRLLARNRIVPPPPVRHALDLAEGAEVWEVRRLRLADGEPVSAERSHIPCELAPDLDRQDLSGSLYALLQEHYGFALQAADQTIRTRAADAEEAQLLAIAEGVPVFIITGLLSEARGRAVEHSRSVWRGDRYDLQVRLVSRD